MPISGCNTKFPLRDVKTEQYNKPLSYIAEACAVAEREENLS